MLQQHKLKLRIKQRRLLHATNRPYEIWYSWSSNQRDVCLWSRIDWEQAGDLRGRCCVQARSAKAKTSLRHKRKQRYLASLVKWSWKESGPLHGSYTLLQCPGYCVVRVAAGIAITIRAVWPGSIPDRNKDFPFRQRRTHARSTAEEAS